MLKQNRTQQINSYLRSQQLLNRHLQLIKRTKKADCIRQDNQSAFNNLAINLTKVNQLNQSTRGVNQYATV